MAGYIGNKAVNLSTSGADISGTANLDAVDIDGAVQIDATLSVGVNDTGYDVKFFGATASRHMTWDESADSLIISGDLDVNDGTIKLDGNYPVGTNNVALGDGALDASLTGASNTAIGSFSLTNNTSGASNTGLGFAALGDTTTGSFNTALGTSALENNTTASGNTAVGYQAAYTNTTAPEGTAVGYKAGYNSTGGYNTFLGYNAGVGQTSGDSNTYIGRGIASGNTSTGGFNTALGNFSFSNNTSGVNNVAVGQQALRNNTTASSNTAVGYQALYTNTTSTSNAAFGNKALHLATGTLNTALGSGAGRDLSSGAKNTIIGAYGGNENGLDIRTSSNNIVLSDGDGNPRGYYHGGLTSPYWIFENDTSNQWVQRFKHTSSGNPYGIVVEFSAASNDNNAQNAIVYTDSSQTRFVVTNQGDVQNHDNSYGSTSDQKLKQQITNASSQWDDIKAITVRKFKYNSDVEDYGDSDSHWRLGVVAQELEAANMTGLVYENPDRDADQNDLGTTTKVVKYSILYMKAVKALQEAMTRIETLEAKVTALEGN